MDGLRPFTAAGLGDRIHHCTVAWCLGPPVTLHLAEQHLRGGQFGNKPESWREIVELFPAGAITLGTDRSLGPLFRYGDYPMPTDGPEMVDAEPLLRRIPLLTPEPQAIDLPDRFVTVQWDANGPSRTAPGEQRRVIAEQLRSEGLATVTVGGEADDLMRWSLKHVAWAMSRAAGHVGADSAFMHLAMLYMPAERIQIHTRKLTHHTRRLRANGGQVTVWP
jgi:hypothetical protein